MSRKRILYPVLLVHGVASDGAWQESVANILRPYFEPVIVRYRHFRGPLGSLFVVCEPWLLLAAAALGAALWLFSVSHWFAWSVVLGVALFSVLPIVVDLRRKAALDAYRSEADGVLLRRPHVIAHSFGTYLTARLLESLNQVVFSRVVLCGCVLSRKYDWQSHVKVGRVGAVRNDFTRNDWVGLPASLVGRMNAHIGNAGTYGMDESLTTVHRLESPLQVCAACHIDAGAIHDVDCSGLGHSTALLTVSHVQRWWLPFLWGYDPADLENFRVLCQTWVDAREKGVWEQITALSSKLETISWDWCGQHTVLTHLQRALISSGKASDPNTVAEVFDALAYRIHSAEAAEHGSPSAQCLNPMVAVNIVVLEHR